MKRNPGSGLDSAIGTFTHSGGGTTRKQAEKMRRARERKERQQTRQNIGYTLAHQARIEFHKTHPRYCPLCGEKMQYAGEPLKSWTGKQKCSQCKVTKRKIGSTKYCVICGKSFTREQHEKEVLSGTGKGSQRWSNRVTCSTCRPQTDKLRILSGEKAKEQLQALQPSKEEARLQKLTPAAQLLLNYKVILPDSEGARKQLARFIEKGNATSGKTPEERATLAREAQAKWLGKNVLLHIDTPRGEQARRGKVTSVSLIEYSELRSIRMWQARKGKDPRQDIYPFKIGVLFEGSKRPSLVRPERLEIIS